MVESQWSCFMGIQRKLPDMDLHREERFSKQDLSKVNVRHEVGWVLDIKTAEHGVSESKRVQEHPTSSHLVLLPYNSL